MFVLALRRRYPTFWRKLNEFWRAGNLADFETWCEERGICDAWLREVCLETIALWETDPSGPNASLSYDYPWFQLTRTSHLGFELPDFNPVFEDPFLTCTRPPDFPERFNATQGKNLGIFKELVKTEGLEEFERRMRSQFEKQLRSYLKQVRESYDYGARPKIFIHAEWTALVFSGAPVGLIADEVASLSADPVDESTIRKAVWRFARKIGLTIPEKPLPSP
jgi:hypothetical protein